MASESILKLQEEDFSTFGYYTFAISVLYFLKTFNHIDMIFVVLSVIHMITILVNGLIVGSFSNILPFIRIMFVAYFVYQLWVKEKNSHKNIINCFVFGVAVAVVFGVIYCFKNGTLFNGVSGGAAGDRNYNRNIMVNHEIGTNQSRLRDDLEYLIDNE